MDASRDAVLDGRRQGYLAPALEKGPQPHPRPDSGDDRHPRRFRDVLPERFERWKSQNPENPKRRSEEEVRSVAGAAALVVAVAASAPKLVQQAIESLVVLTE